LVSGPDRGASKRSQIHRDHARRSRQLIATLAFTRARDPRFGVIGLPIHEVGSMLRCMSGSPSETKLEASAPLTSQLVLHRGRGSSVNWRSGVGSIWFAGVLVSGACNSAAPEPLTNSARPSLSREQFVKEAAKARTRDIQDRSAADPRYPTRPPSDRHLAEFIDWADRNVRAADVEDAPPCTLPATSQDRGRRCCIEGRISRKGSTGALAERNGFVVPVSLIGEPWENPKIEHRRVCGFVAGLLELDDGSVPMLVGFAL
jgi:hypothetical protein